MNVIKVQNLQMPAPSEKELPELRASLAALAGPQDPLTASLYAENWPGRQATHLVYYAGLRTLTELHKLDETKLGPISWRFFAGGHQTMTSAAGCMATRGGPGLPPAKVLAITRGPAPAGILTSTELLNELSELTGNPHHQYELRVLRIPALGMEAFWLKSLSAHVADLVVPYGSLPGAWSITKPGAKAPAGHQALPAADFLKLAGDLAKQRLAKPDIAHPVRWSRTRGAPVKLARPHSLHLPKPGGSLWPKGVHVSAQVLQRIGAPKTPPGSEPDRVAKAGG